MKNIIYISCEGNGEKRTGVGKKIHFQIKAMEKLGFNVNYIYLKDKNIINNNIKIGEVGIKILRRVLLFKELSKIELPKTDYIYIRYPGTTPLFLYFLKKNYKDKKIILEIPTYPYDKEAKSYLLKIYLLLDKITRSYLKKYISNIITYSEDKKIYGITCINIQNGIDLEEIKIKKEKTKKKDQIILTSVSLCAYWHGIDRMINSMENYYKNGGKENLMFNIVGEGEESEKLQSLIKKSKLLNERVKFLGFKEGDELDKIYDETDIGVGCLANHRKNIYTVQALKNREYAAKGLPMIFSEDDPGFRNVKFVYQASFDERLINIEKLIEWYKNLDIKSQEIREYAKEFSWEIQMKKIIEKMK